MEKKAKTIKCGTSTGKNYQTLAKPKNNQQVNKSSSPSKHRHANTYFFARRKTQHGH